MTGVPHDDRVLAHLRHHGESYGYALARALGISTGRISNVLRRMENAGLLVSELRVDRSAPGFPTRRYYQPVNFSREEIGVTDPTVYLDDVPLRRVVLAVVCDVPAVTSADAASIARVTVGRALDAAPNRLRRGPASHRPGTTLRHLRDDRADDPRDVYVTAVEDLRIAVANGLVALVPLGSPEPPPTPEETT